MNLGGTGDPPVLGGNLPPSLRQEKVRVTRELPARTQGGGRVAHRNGPVARSTRITLGLCPEDSATSNAPIQRTAHTKARLGHDMRLLRLGKPQ
jgi:hypothetical protein